MMLLIWSIIFIFYPSIIYADKHVVVHTDYGDVEGYETDLARIFYGIPYAQPPINTLRYSLKEFLCMLDYSQIPVIYLQVESSSSHS